MTKGNSAVASEAVDPYSRRLKTCSWVFVICAVIVGTFVAVVRSFEDFDPDCGVFLTFGRLIERGFLPYADFFDHKPPLVYLSGIGVRALLRSVGLANIDGRPSLLVTYGSWVVIVNLVNIVVLMNVARLWKTPIVLACSAAVALTVLTPVQGIFTEPLAAMFGLLSFRCCLNLWVTRTGTFTKVVAAGLLVGISMCAKQIGLFYVGGISLMLAASYWRSYAAGEACMSWIWACFSIFMFLCLSCVPLGVLWLVYAGLGHADDLVYCLVTFNLQEYGHSPGWTGIVAWFLTKESVQLLAVLTIGLAGIPTTAWSRFSGIVSSCRIEIGDRLNQRQSESYFPEFLGLIATIGLSMISLFKGALPLYQPAWLPFELLLICLMGSRLVYAWTESFSRACMGVILASIILIQPSVVVRTLYQGIKRPLAFSVNYELVTAKLREHVKPEDKVLQIRVDSALYWLLDVVPAYRYIWYSSTTEKHYPNLEAVLRKCRVDVVIVSTKLMKETEYSRLCHLLKDMGYVLAVEVVSPEIKPNPDLRGWREVSVPRSERYSLFRKDVHYSSTASVTKI